jgi:hypothetical protein
MVREDGDGDDGAPGLAQIGDERRQRRPRSQIFPSVMARATSIGSAKSAIGRQAPTLVGTPHPDLVQALRKRLCTQKKRWKNTLPLPKRTASAPA